MALRAAVIGIGAWGLRHAEKYAALPGVELYLVDTDPATAKGLAERLGCGVVASYRDLPSLGVQCASVVTPAHNHFEVASWLLQNGLDLLVEKPICVNIEDGARLVELAQLHSRVLQVGHIERFNPAYQLLKDRVHGPQHIAVRRECVFNGRCSDVDVVLDLMIHDLDLVLDLVQRQVVSVKATGQAVTTNLLDSVTASVMFDGDVEVHLTASRVAARTCRSLHLADDKGEYFLDFVRRSLRCSDGEAREAPSTDPLRAQIESFISCVQSRAVPVVTGECGVRALQLAGEIRGAVGRDLGKLETRGFAPLER